MLVSASYDILIVFVVVSDEESLYISLNLDHVASLNVISKLLPFNNQIV
jgi:hypothetical protein